MKSFICILAILGVAVCVEWKPSEDMQKIMQECRTEVGITEEKRGPAGMNDPNTKCFFACVMEKTGKMVDGKANLEKMWETYQKMDPKADDTVKEKLSNCVTAGNEKSDRCEVVAAVIKCINEKIDHGHQGPLPSEN